jgi:hypothetical protein
MTHTRSRRSAFTLVEMLVASALIIFMMFIIASAFEKGLESFRVLKTQSDMQDKLRAVAATIRLDLTAQHFGDGSSLSDQRLNDQLWQPPTKGYFRISQPAPLPGQPGAGVQEGVDPDSPLAKYYQMTPAAAQALYLQFTVNLTNGHPSLRDARARRDQFFITKTDPDTTLNPYSAPDYNRDGSTNFTSYWSEVTIFAKPNGLFTDGGLPLLNLYRRQLLLIDSPTINGVPPYPAVATNSLKDVSAFGAPPKFNRPADVTEPIRRWGMGGSAAVFGQPPTQQTIYNRTIDPPFQTLFEEAVANQSPGSPYISSPYLDPQLGPRIGGDLLLTNVVNFEIKVLWEPVVPGAANASRFMPPMVAGGNIVGPADYIGPSATSNPDYPFDFLPAGVNPGINSAGTNSPRIFDTWSSNRDKDPNNPPQYDFNYGVDRNKYLDSTGQPIGPQPGLSTDPNFANWNIGHFMPLPGIPANSPALTPTQYSIPLRVRVRAIQIKLRIWDKKSSQTRQMTLIQDM